MNAAHVGSNRHGMAEEAVSPMRHDSNDRAAGRPTKTLFAEIGVDEGKREPEAGTNWLKQSPPRNRSKGYDQWDATHTPNLRVPRANAAENEIMSQPRMQPAF